jgi:DNA-binding beta-propeller fold protein YncE
MRSTGGRTLAGAWLGIWLGLMAGALPAAGQAPSGAPKLEFLFAAPKNAADATLLNPTGVACDPGRGHVFVADSAHNRVLVFNQVGSLLYSFKHWVKSPTGQRTLGAPSHLLPWDNGTLLVTDILSGHLDIVDIYGTVLASTDLASLLQPKQQARPSAMGEDQAGNLYVLETQSQQVVVLNHGMTRVLRVFGGQGTANDKFEGAADLAVAPEGTTYVLDGLGEPVVHVFDAQGKQVASFGQKGDREEDFHHPTGLALDEAGHLWIVDSIAQQLSCYTTSGTFLVSFGGLGTGPGQFYFPVSVAYGAGIIYVLEKAGARVQAFRIVS